MTLRHLLALCERLREEDRRALIGPAQICMVIANAHRNPRKRSRPFTVEDFLPQNERTVHIAVDGDEQSPDEMATALVAVFGVSEKPSERGIELSLAEYLTQCSDKQLAVSGSN